MWNVYRWYKDEIEGDSTELIASFTTESDAEHFVVFYSMLHMISVDDLSVCGLSTLSLPQLIDTALDICKKDLERIGNL